MDRVALPLILERSFDITTKANFDRRLFANDVLPDPSDVGI
jgi:hypothetical protein